MNFDLKRVLNFFLHVLYVYFMLSIIVDIILLSTRTLIGLFRFWPTRCAIIIMVGFFIDSLHFGELEHKQYITIKQAQKELRRAERRQAKQAKQTELFKQFTDRVFTDLFSTSSQ